MEDEAYNCAENTAEPKTDVSLLIAMTEEQVQIFSGCWIGGETAAHWTVCISIYLGIIFNLSDSGKFGAWNPSKSLIVFVLYSFFSRATKIKKWIG